MTAELDLVAELRVLASLLDGAGIPYAICGGIAVTIHGSPRATKDIDLLVRGSDIESIVERVRPLGWRFRALPLVFGRDTPAERHLTRVTRIQGAIVLMLDLIAVTPVFERVWEERMRVAVEGQELSVVSLEGLRAMKRLAGRAQDLADLEKLGLT